MVDVIQSIKDPPKKICPECGKHTLERVIYGGAGAFVRNVNTVGQLADKNWRDKGHYEKSEILAKPKKTKASEPLQNKKATATRQEINNMTEKQKQKYIMRGEK